MKVTREVKFGAWVASAVLIAVASFVIGGMLKPEEPPHYVYDVTAPAYQADLGLLAAKSPGGFTGFGDLAEGNSRTVLGGRITELTGESMTLETTAGVLTTMRLGPAPKLARLIDASRDELLPGATVLVRLGEQENEAAAVLVMSPP